MEKAVMKVSNKSGAFLHPLCIRFPSPQCIFGQLWHRPCSQCGDRRWRASMFLSNWISLWFFRMRSYRLHLYEYHTQQWILAQCNYHVYWISTRSEAFLVLWYNWHERHLEPIYCNPRKDTKINHRSWSAAAAAAVLNLNKSVCLEKAFHAATRIAELYGCVEAKHWPFI